jgi:DNA (cytosine-5)-methyltransferase 1
MRQKNLFESLDINLKQDDSVLDLYSGAGGLGSGFAKFFNVGVAVDHNFDACQTYRANHKEVHVRQMDVTVYVDSCVAKDFEMIMGTVGGPPCQPYSNLNLKKKSGDKRVLELDCMVNAVLVIQPEFALIENVRTIKRSKKLQIVRTLERAGYKVVARIVNAYDFGSVQLRPRWIVTACKSKHIFPTPRPSGRTAKEILTDDVSQITPTPRVLQAIQDLPSGKWVSLPNRVFKAYFVIDPDKPVPCVANPTKLRYIKPDKSGYLSIKEMAMAQGFPASYQFCGNLSSIGQQLANVFPVEMAQTFAMEFAIQLVN